MSGKKYFFILLLFTIVYLSNCATKTAVRPVAEYVNYDQETIDKEEKLKGLSYSLADNDQKRILGLVTVENDTLDFGDPGAVIYTWEEFVIGATTENIIVKIPFGKIKLVKTKEIDVLRSLLYLGVYGGLAYLVFDGIMGDSFDMFGSCSEAGY